MTMTLTKTISMIPVPKDKTEPLGFQNIPKRIGGFIEVYKIVVSGHFPTLAMFKQYFFFCDIMAKY